MRSIFFLIFSLNLVWIHVFFASMNCSCILSIQCFSQNIKSKSKNNDEIYRPTESIYMSDYKFRLKDPLYLKLNNSLTIFKKYNNSGDNTLRLDVWISLDF